MNGAQKALMVRPPQSEAQELLNFSAHLLNEKTPRALVVIGAARIEEELKTIAAKIEPGADDDRKSHASRIKLLATADILSEDTAFCLGKLAKIRNHFAHTSANVALDDVGVSPHANELFERLERHTKLKESTGQFFASAPIAKIPEHLLPATWARADWRKLQIAIVFLLYHLIILRYNLPPRRKPIEIDGYDFDQSHPTQREPELR